MQALMASSGGGKRGGYSNAPLTPAGAHANYQISNLQGPINPTMQALMASSGGRRRKRGGYSNAPLTPTGADANYKISDSQGPNNTTMQALMASSGGRRRKRGGYNSRKRGGYSNYPLTPAGADANYKISDSQGPNNTTMQALMASS